MLSNQLFMDTRRLLLQNDGCRKKKGSVFMMAAVPVSRVITPSLESIWTVRFSNWRLEHTIVLRLTLNHVDLRGKWWRLPGFAAADNCRLFSSSEIGESRHNTVSKMPFYCWFYYAKTIKILEALLHHVNWPIVIVIFRLNWPDYWLNALLPAQLLGIFVFTAQGPRPDGRASYFPGYHQSCSG